MRAQVGVHVMHEELRALGSCMLCLFPHHPAVCIRPPFALPQSFALPFPSAFSSFYAFELCSSRAAVGTFFLPRATWVFITSSASYNSLNINLCGCEKAPTFIQFRVPPAGPAQWFCGLVGQTSPTPILEFYFMFLVSIIYSISIYLSLET